MTLPWIVIFAAFAFFIVWKSGVFERRDARRLPRPRKTEIPDKAGAEGDRLKVFEDFLRNLTDEDKSDGPPKGRPPRTG